MSGNVFDRVLNAAGEALIIAELGTGHGGDELKAMELAAAAVEAGADCVKLQHVYADEIIHPETGLVPL
ncbi:MAG TPA: spore coat protein, partial [Spirochaetales bacterium]|nr:spore coat protein [Spirochaetales bacterium]